ncbi:MAG: hypothetical protein JWR38_5280 [Mucilaginibacter sp.]|nr:hypothetical protein [Mucilaginibacter sp.]
MFHHKRVLVSCGTKFHSDHVSWQLYKNGLLEKTVTAHPPGKYLNRVNLPRKRGTFLPPIFVIPYVLYKIPYIGNTLARLIEYRLPAIFDFMASFFTSEANISLSWSWASWYTIKRIKARNGIAILEESGSCNLYQNELLADEYSRLNLRFRNKTPAYIIRRELREADLADFILCPSQHVANTFIEQGIPKEKFVIIPYGVNLERFSPSPNSAHKFRIIFVGTIGVRKGLIYLFKALEALGHLPDLECILVGGIEVGFEPIFKQYQHLVTYLGRVSQEKLATIYQSGAVFVFPSLDEGMALVQLEAMACGLPVITTINAGADAVIQNGIQGFFIPVRDTEALREKIHFLYQNPLIRRKMAENALKRAQEFTWDRYGDQLSAFINTL